MASPADLPSYLKEEPTQECKEIIASLPSQPAWLHRQLHQYQGFWYPTGVIEGVLAFQKHFVARDSDVILTSYIKTGTTWMKALIFALMNRELFVNDRKNHPLLKNNPHSLVLTMEFDVYVRKESVGLSDFESPRLFSTHVPFVSLPTSIKESECKIVYIGRDPKDTFISLWHFMNKLKHESMEKISLETAFNMFCNGVSSFGPVWEHLLSYWNERMERSERILFLKFEEMKENPLVYTRRLAEFLGCPFSVKEERQGMVDDILKLCSFENMSQLEVNKNEKLRKGNENNVYFRKGDVGDWKNYLTPEMVEQIDGITKEKLSGSGLKL